MWNYQVSPVVFNKFQTILQFLQNIGHLSSGDLLSLPVEDVVDELSNEYFRAEGEVVLAQFSNFVLVQILKNINLTFSLMKSEKIK